MFHIRNIRVDIKYLVSEFSIGERQIHGLKVTVIKDRSDNEYGRCFRKINDAKKKKWGDGKVKGEMSVYTGEHDFKGVWVGRYSGLGGKF